MNPTIQTSTIEPLANAHCACGENPYYDRENGRVLWTDIPKGRLFEWNLQTQKWRQFYDGPTVGGFTLQADGALLLFGENQISRLDAQGHLQVLADGVALQSGRFNDVIADPEGRVFAGTMGRDGANGGLFRVDLDGSVTQLWEGTECANGMGFTPDLSGFYWTDSSAKIIFRFDYNRATGELSNRRPFVIGTPEMQTPDGMTVDNDGTVWSAVWDGHCVRHYDSEGKTIEEIRFPVAKVSSCVFGGPQMNQLFVTTAGGEDDAESEDGTLYRVQLNVSGREEFRSRIQFS